MQKTLVLFGFLSSLSSSIAHSSDLKHKDSWEACVIEKTIEGLEHKRCVFENWIFDLYLGESPTGCPDKRYKGPFDDCPLYVEGQDQKKFIELFEGFFSSSNKAEVRYFKDSQRFSLFVDEVLPFPQGVISEISIEKLMETQDPYDFFEQCSDEAPNLCTEGPTNG